MKLKSPKLNIDEEATDRLIESSLSKLKGEIDSFAILGSDEMNYIQALATENGFVVQFQKGSVDEHYEFDTYLSRPQTIQLFQAYLQGTKNWQGNLSYSKVKLMGRAGKLGFTFGSFFGSLIKGFKDGRKKHNKRLQSDAQKTARRCLRPAPCPVALRAPEQGTGLVVTRLHAPSAPQASFHESAPRLKGDSLQRSDRDQFEELLCFSQFAKAGLR